MGKYKFDLFDKLAGARTLTEFYRLNESRFELVAQNISCLDFENVVSKCNKVCDCIVFHILFGFQEGLHFPFLVISWIQFFVMGSSRDYCNVILNFLENFW